MPAHPACPPSSDNLPTVSHTPPLLCMSILSRPLTLLHTPAQTRPRVVAYLFPQLAHPFSPSVHQPPPSARAISSPISPVSLTDIRQSGALAVPGRSPSSIASLPLLTLTSSLACPPPALARLLVLVLVHPSLLLAHALVCSLLTSSFVHSALFPVRLSCPPASSPSYQLTCVPVRSRLSRPLALYGLHALAVAYEVHGDNITSHGNGSELIDLLKIFDSDTK
ncbi:uncharacterized protein B0H18DRAFT_1117418 [Fomitopsis serialis]|uniref:uncharacterized protein n=1 Tax=Fomitopsis serialis TaxID=139415 RepID=UPI0020082F4B|nr:uncharacterized protein B0H18DRAFT_1117418 [Neoantrodia serialis]KAH9929378.1 hypothetical protein B0H18DRAFT_1117418 [Neoantrodia serialis]